MGIFQAPDGAGYVECDVCHFVDGPIKPLRPVNDYTTRKWRTQSLSKNLGKTWLCSDDCEDNFLARVGQ